MAQSFWKPGEYEEFIGVKGCNPMSQKLVSRTHFRKSNTEDQGWQWFWTTMTPDEADVVGDGGEGYSRIAKAMNGFFSQQGVPRWEPSELGTQSLPEGYTLQKIDDDHYVVSKFAEDRVRADDE